MISCDKNKIMDLNYIKTLLEGKYIKLEDDNSFIIYYVKTVYDVFQPDANDKTIDEIGICFDCYYVNLDCDSEIGNLHGNYMDLDMLLNVYSLTTKECFLASCKIVMDMMDDDNKIIK